MKPFPFEGLYLAVATPFDSNGAIDHAAFESLIERYLDAGVRGFVLSSGTGMHVYLSQAESMELIARGCRIVDGRASIIAQTSALLSDDVVLRTKHATDHGAGGVMVLPPFFEGPSDDAGVLAFYSEVAKANAPVIGYNVPQAVGVEITPSLFEKLAEIPAFCMVKDSSGDLIAQANLIRTGLPVMNGADPLALYALYAGAQGLIWGGANFAPRSCVALFAAAKRGDWDEARRIWTRLAPAMSLIWRGDYVASVYAAAAMTGYGFGDPRRPLAALSREKRAALREALAPLIEFEKVA